MDMELEKQQQVDSGSSKNFLSLHYHYTQGSDTFYRSAMPHLVAALDYNR